MFDTIKKINTWEGKEAEEYGKGAGDGERVGAGVGKSRGGDVTQRDRGRETEGHDNREIKNFGDNIIFFFSNVLDGNTKNASNIFYFPNVSPNTSFIRYF